MPSTKHCSPMPSIHADDDEIRRYAKLLDSLSVGLMVFASDTSPCFRNEHADKLLGASSSPDWIGENGQPIAIDEQPLTMALCTSQAVLDRIVGLTTGAANCSWLSVNAIPVFSEDGGVRRVLLTMTDISEQRILKSEIEQLSIRDPLTGVFNRQHVFQLLENEIHRARRYGTPFTLAHLDIDLFLPLCAEHGEEMGDNILAGIGQLLKNSLREIDMAGRIGNDEFLLVLPNVSLRESTIGLERLRMLIETQTFGNAELRVTISGGITEYTGENSAALMERSKALLVNAREAGRNRFCLDADIL